MTPLPAVPPEARLTVPPAHPPLPPVAHTCTAPGCGRTAQHRHHAVPRGRQRALFGSVHDFLLINGHLSLVLVDLCPTHHDLLESGYGGCKSRLRWAGGWVWYDRINPVRAYDLTVNNQPDPSPVIWLDARTDTYWQLRGFCDGEYRFDS